MSNTPKQQSLTPTKPKIKQLKSLDYSIHQNRKFLVQSFRTLETIVNKRYKYW